jgi:hypothetical protein
MMQWWTLPVSVPLDDLGESPFPKNEILLDSGISEEFEMVLISEVAPLQDSFGVVRFLQHFPTPQSYPEQYGVS